jgi:DNA-binding NarL/FixJ family response regulator
MKLLLAIAKLDLRLSIELTLSHEPNVQVIGTTSTSDSLLALLETSCPDMILVDWNLPGALAAELIPELIKNNKSIKIIVIGEDPASRPIALRAGAKAFVNHSAPPELLIDAFRRVRFEHESADQSSSN